MYKGKSAGLRIRVMAGADYPQASALWNSTPDLGMRPLDDSEAGIQAFLARNPRTCFVAEHEGVLAGALLSGHDGRRGFIYHAAVQKEYRCRGLGSALAAAAEQALSREGIRKIALVVFGSNETGNRFWEKRGFLAREDLVYRDKSLHDQHI
ncbi:MAG: GNAT family N-acetyltransferase [Spirochaetaceae bacterium]|jgi:ribosomal protein S18 acetylase RimI-like enzyme|nr:GNAT family N-acetyltransferase [Spirochaetaceae bacterium]